MLCGSTAWPSASRGSLRTAADGLPDGVGEDGAECGGSDEQRRDRPLINHVNQDDADDAADGERPECVGDSAEPSFWAAMMLSERPETLRACCHSCLFYTMG